MARIVTTKTAKRLAGGQTVLREAEGGMRRIRCPATHQVATPTTDESGNTVLRAPDGTTYKTTRLK